MNLIRAAGVAVSTLLLLGLVEAGLALGGVQGLDAERDPFQGFSARVHVFQPEPARGVYATPPAAVARSFNHQEFRLEKPAKGYRVFTLGGSSAYGFPWGAEIAFTKVLRDALAASHPERTVEAVNASGMSYGSNRLRVLSHEILDYAPDAVIFYEGHNEFVEDRFYRDLIARDERLDTARSLLHRWRLFTVATRVSERMRRAEAPSTAASLVGLDVERDEPTGVDPVEKERVRARFEINLRDIVSRLQARGVTVVLCTAAANLRDWKPYTAQEAHAEFARARTFEAAGNWDAARAAYIRARDLDGQPARVLSSINETTRRVAADTGAMLVDIEREFEAASPNGLVGFNLIEDYVHPNASGHRLIALALWRAFEARGLAGSPRQVSADEFWRVVGRAPADPLSSGGDVPGWRRAALLYNTGVILEHQGELARAIEKYREALAAYPQNAGAATNLGRLLALTQDTAGSAVAYQLAVDANPHNARALAGLGRALVQLGRSREAEGVLERAIAIEPSVGSWSFLGHARRMHGDRAGAEQAYRAALAIDPADKFVTDSLRAITAPR